jgi:hypothetical protein
MKDATTANEWKNFLWAIRIYALIIIAVLVISDFTVWLSEDTVTYVSHHAHGTIHDYAVVSTVSDRAQGSSDVVNGWPHRFNGAWNNRILPRSLLNS